MMRLLHPALLGALLLSACLTPTEGTGRFGEARVQPEFTAGDAPDERGVDVETIRTIMVRGTETVVHAHMTYEPDAAQAWILELQNDADSVEVTMELLVAGNVAYRGARTISVVEGSPGRAPVEDIPVMLIESAFASRIEVTPTRVLFTKLGATQQLTATVYDADNNVIDKDVIWSSANGGVASVDANGVVTAAGHGSTSILATANGVTGTATVTVDTTLARYATITADSVSIAADSIASTLLTVRILDSSGAALGMSAGKVLLATTLGRLGSVTDHHDGTYTATLTAGRVPGNAVVTGTLNDQAINDDATVQFRAQHSNAKHSTIDADSSALDADGKSRTLITVQVLDAQGKPVGTTGDTVALTTTLGALSGVSPHSNGTYTVTLVAGNIPGAAVIAGTLNGQPIGDSAFVFLRPVVTPVSSTRLTSDSAAIDSDGVSTTRVSVAVLNANGVLIGRSAGPVVLTTTLGKIGPVADHGNGTYTATLTSDTASGTAVISGTLNGQLIPDTAGVVFRPDPGHPGTTTITADSAAINRGGVASTRVLVTLRDAQGNLVGASGGIVLLTTTYGTLTAVTDHGDGTYSAVLTSALDAGVAVITGTLNGMAITSSATVQFRQART